MLLENDAMWNVASGTRRAAAASSTRRRMTVSLRRNARSSPVGPCATSSWRITGSLSRASRPIALESRGTSRQPSGCWPSSTAMRTHSSSQRRRSAGIVRQEAHRDGVVAGRRQLELELLAREAAQQPVGHLQHQPGAVARVGIGPARPAVLHRGQHRERALDHLAAAHAVGARDQAEAARIVLEAPIVKGVLVERLHESRVPED